MVAWFKQGANSACTQGAHKELNINAASAALGVILDKRDTRNVVGRWDRAVERHGTERGERGFDEGPGRALPAREDSINFRQGLGFGKEPGHGKCRVFYNEVAASVRGAHTKRGPEGEAVFNARGQVRGILGATREHPLGKDGRGCASEDAKVTDNISREVNMQRVPIRRHSGGAAKGSNAQAKGLQPAIERARGTLMHAHESMQSRQLEGITERSSNIISHSNSNVGRCRRAIRIGWERDTFKLDRNKRAIGKRDGSGSTRGTCNKGEIGLHGDKVGKGCTGITLTDPVAEGDGTTKEAIDFDTCGGTGKQDAEERREGGRDVHGIEGA